MVIVLIFNFCKNQYLQQFHNNKLQMLYQLLPTQQLSNKQQKFPNWFRFYILSTCPNYLSQNWLCDDRRTLFKSNCQLCQLSVFASPIFYTTCAEMHVCCKKCISKYVCYKIFTKQPFTCPAYSCDKQIIFLDSQMSFKNSPKLQKEYQLYTSNIFFINNLSIRFCSNPGCRIFKKITDQSSIDFMRTYFCDACLLKKSQQDLVLNLKETIKNIQISEYQRSLIQFKFAQLPQFHPIIHNQRQQGTNNVQQLKTSQIHKQQILHLPCLLRILLTIFLLITLPIIFILDIIFLMPFVYIYSVLSIGLMCYQSSMLRIHIFLIVAIKILMIILIPVIFIGCILFFYAYQLVGKGGIIWTKINIKNIVALCRGC